MTEGKFIPGNQSANTPDLSETELRAMKMPELIELAHQERIPDVDDMRRDDLIRAISAVHRQRREQSAGAGGQQQSAGQQSGSSGQQQSGSSGQQQSGSAGQQQPEGGGQGQGRDSGQPAEGKFIPGNQSPATPDLSETELRGMQMPELRERARQEGIEGADEMRRDELISAISARHRERQLHPQR
ncbi:hypothetical protein HC028_20165 [Planosporangium flavigriseum]|uniref:Rho termination factor-like N-terminal domain-containing protein n=1 Tax=Planosporangium flavigriseum TaxID=373681 RepID=A0A8J3LT12_9ACTN|nr:Rho termination factor N-terminal domain-containing protein [Planosporangium flavigriseum]NJC66805.1 hypothetical protein [Planosporangium flavigriseum]GIG76295.1 hypothetical protein Pfl04_46990 [Planosporangium flavigriseum]